MFGAVGAAPAARPAGGLRRTTCDPRQCVLQRGRGVDPGGKPFEHRRHDQRVTRKVDQQLAGERLALVEPRGQADRRAGLAVETAQREMRSPVQALPSSGCSPRAIISR